MRKKARGSELLQAVSLQGVQKSTSNHTKQSIRLHERNLSFFGGLKVETSGAKGPKGWRCMRGFQETLLLSELVSV